LSVTGVSQYSPLHCCAPKLPALQGIPARSPHPAVPVQHQPTPRSAMLRLAPGRSGRHGRAVRTVGRPVGQAGAGGGKRPFDNHLEGSSIKRYSEVAEAMSNLPYHPIEETEDVTLWRN